MGSPHQGHMLWKTFCILSKKSCNSAVLIIRMQFMSHFDQEIFYCHLESERRSCRGWITWLTHAEHGIGHCGAVEMGCRSGATGHVTRKRKRKKKKNGAIPAPQITWQIQPNSWNFWRASASNPLCPPPSPCSSPTPSLFLSSTTFLHHHTQHR